MLSRILFLFKRDFDHDDITRDLTMIIVFLRYWHRHIELKLKFIY